MYESVFLVVSLTFIDAKRSGPGGSLITQREFRGPILLQDMLLAFITIIKVLHELFFRFAISKSSL